MASLSSSNPSSNSVGRELSIASIFVKQYYTILNKAPYYIHNFYSHDSTFIHGTIEMADEQYSEPIVGREKIQKKMGELKLKDCRAKIKQIDCLETLAGGLVIQVIGELSNDGKPMRRFLQTFVLAPSPEDKSDSDQQHAKQSASDRPSTQQGESGSTHNQKFYVLNSIFRYQDDGLESEFPNETVVSRDEATNEESNGGGDVSKPDSAAKQTSGGRSSKQFSDDALQARRPRVPPEQVKVSDDTDRVISEVDNLKLNKPTEDGETKRDIDAKVVPNGTVNSDKKNEVCEKSENGKTSKFTPLVTPRPQPSNEPKTWANMLRNAHPPSASTPTSVIKSGPGETQQASPQTQQPAQQPQSSQQPQQQSPNQQPQQQNQNQQQQQQPQNNNNNRKRFMHRRVTRPTKNRPRPAV